MCHGIFARKGLKTRGFYGINGIMQASLSIERHVFGGFLVGGCIEVRQPAVTEAEAESEADQLSAPVRYQLLATSHYLSSNLWVELPIKKSFAKISYKTSKDLLTVASIFLAISIGSILIMLWIYQGPEVYQMLFRVFHNAMFHKAIYALASLLLIIIMLLVGSYFRGYKTSTSWVDEVWYDGDNLRFKQPTLFGNYITY
jgi:hypothetical protein